MPAPTKVLESLAASEVGELDEAQWQAWKVRGAMRDRDTAAALMAAVKYGSLVVLVITTGLGVHAAPYHLVIRSAFSVGAAAVAAQAFRLRRSGFAAAFVSMMLIYNPVFPFFSMTNGLPIPLGFLTLLALFASLIELRAEPAGSGVSQATCRQAPPDRERPILKTGLPVWENEGGACMPPELEPQSCEQNGASK